MNNDINPEQEANLFAMELLMPERFVRDEVNKLGGIDLADDEAMKGIAKKFRVNITLMAVRIGQLYPRVRG